FPSPCRPRRSANVREWKMKSSAVAVESCGQPTAGNDFQERLERFDRLPLTDYPLGMGKTLPPIKIRQKRSIEVRHASTQAYIDHMRLLCASPIWLVLIIRSDRLTA